MSYLLQRVSARHLSRQLLGSLEALGHAVAASPELHEEVLRRLVRPYTRFCFSCNLVRSYTRWYTWRLTTVSCCVHPDAVPTKAPPEPLPSMHSLGGCSAGAEPAPVERRCAGGADHPARPVSPACVGAPARTPTLPDSSSLLIFPRKQQQNLAD